MTSKAKVVYLFYFEGECAEQFSWNELLETGCIRHMQWDDTTDVDSKKRNKIREHLESDLELIIDWKRIDCGTDNEYRLLKCIQDFLTVGRYRSRTRLYTVKYDLAQQKLTQKDINYWEAVENDLKLPFDYNDD